APSPHHYTHLCSDFRTIEIGKLCHFRQVPAASLRYLLQEYPLTTVSVPTFVGGVRREEQGEVVCTSQITERQGPQGKYVEAQLQGQRYHQSFRGGIEVAVRLTADQFGEERAGVFAEFRRQVRVSRPSPHALLWSIAS